MNNSIKIAAFLFFVSIFSCKDKDVTDLTTIKDTDTDLANDLTKMSCKFIVKGVFEYTPESMQMRTVDYGNGDCDSKAVVTIAGVDFNITLK